MNTAELSALNQQVLWTAFFLSAGFGAVVQRTGFCTMGAVSDVFALGDWTRLRQWGLATAVATIGFAALAGLGWISAPQTLYANTRWLWLSALVGGLLFGFGMVLSSGCISKNLVRVGGGSLKALVVILVTGVSAFATLKGLTAVWRDRTVDRIAVDFGQNADLATWAAQAWGLAPAVAALVCGSAIGGVLLLWSLGHREARRANNLLAGLGVGGLVAAMWWVSGHLGHVAEHPQTLEETWLATNSTRAEALSFVGPTAYALDWVMFYSDASKRLTVGIVSVLGVVLGSLAVALLQRSFRWQGFAGTADVGHHLVGGLLMGVGGITAYGCSIGQGVSGFSTLSAMSFVAVAAMIAGAVAGLKYQSWRLERED